MRRLLISLTITAGLVLALVPCANADTISYEMDIGSAELTGYSGPYASLTINLINSTTAEVTFTSDTNGGYIYLMGGNGAVLLNVNGDFSVGTVTETNSISGFAPSFKDISDITLDGFGTLNLSIDNNKGFKGTATTISFTLTATNGNSWASASDVLIPNSDGIIAAVHAYACAEPGCSSTSGALAIGYAADPVPEPATATLLGAGLLLLGIFRRRLHGAEWK
jgi:PEP-CTERM motif